MVSTYLGALGLTLVVEVPLYVVALTTAAGVGWRRAVAMAVGVNAITHPIAWWSLRPFDARSSYPIVLIGVELVVCVVEWLLLVAWSRRVRSDIALLAVVSVGANAASTLIGLLLAG
jgi:hypothetical protein